MAIEIKELVIKFTIEKPHRDGYNPNSQATISDKKVRDIVEQCTEAVLSKLSRYEER